MVSTIFHVKLFAYGRSNIFMTILMLPDHNVTKDTLAMFVHYPTK